MAEQAMTPSRFLNLKRSYSQDAPTKAMADLNLPEALKKTEDRPSPILKGSEKYQSPGSAAQKGLFARLLSSCHQNICNQFFNWTFYPHGNRLHRFSRHLNCSFLQSTLNFILPRGKMSRCCFYLEGQMLTTTPAVSIAEPEIESISPLMRGKWKEVPGDSESEYFNLDRASSKHHRTSIPTKRLSGRPSIEVLKQSRRMTESSATPGESGNESSASARPSLSRPSADEELFARVGQWIQQERARRSATKEKQASSKSSAAETLDGSVNQKERRASDASGGTTALDELQKILDRTMSFTKQPVASYRRTAPRSPKLMAKLRRPSSIAASSDTDYFEEPIVPSSDAVLDNSKTLTYTSKTPLMPAKDAGSLMRRASSAKMEDAWKTFKFEIVRLAHTLRIKGWRRVPMELSGGIEVERLSGALTNAVYVVSPPKDLPPVTPARADSNDSQPRPRKPPPELLLRIYGAQVNHLIDRESELAILRRLAKKHIGPRLLGTFANGRFEEFFHARTLTAKDIRDKDMSRQIAKRMRELHEGIDLLPEERSAGPFVWKNINSWTKRCSMLVHWLDEQVLKAGQQPPLFVCGTEWDIFFAVLQKYKAWLYQQYGGDNKVKDRLVFAHNDVSSCNIMRLCVDSNKSQAQYGNILRLTPSGESPLLLPQNEHKRLVVIDFEYANANPPGLEFANHFTEWCYNYHDPNAPYACNTKLYPTLEEQERFIKAYVTHRPNLPGSTPGTPLLPPAMPSSGGGSSMISSFMLDARSPINTSASAPNLTQSQDWVKDEEARLKAIRREVEYLLWETRLWRLSNSAQWVMWGVMQAKIPGLPVELGGSEECVDSPEVKELQLPDSGFVDGDTAAVDVARAQVDGVVESREASLELGTDPRSPEVERLAEAEKDKRPEDVAEAEEEAFDYLGYARERALFFWGDAVGLGIVKREELPESLRREIRVVE